MSESASRFDVIPRRETYCGVQVFDGSWALKVFLISLIEAPLTDVDRMRRVLATMLASIESRMSPEFDYGRFGVAIVHVGRRGICVTVTHFGGWGTTFEVFSSTWYRYGQLFEKFELLDDIEPAVCWFEVRRVFQEITLACELAKTERLAEVRDSYLSAEVVDVT